MYLPLNVLITVGFQSSKNLTLIFLRFCFFFFSCFSFIPLVYFYIFSFLFILTFFAIFLCCFFFMFFKSSCFLLKWQKYDYIWLSYLFVYWKVWKISVWKLFKKVLCRCNKKLADKAKHINYLPAFFYLHL